MEIDKSVIYRILSVGLLNSLGRPKQSPVAPLLRRLYFKSFLSSRPKSIQQNTVEIHRLAKCFPKFTTSYTNMCNHSKARISGLSVFTHARNRTIRLAVGDLGSRLCQQFNKKLGKPVEVVIGLIFKITRP